MKNQKGSARAKSLALVDMSSAFVVLGLGISLSLLVFITEVISKRIQNHYFHHQCEDHNRQKVIQQPNDKQMKSESKPSVEATSITRHAKNKTHGDAVRTITEIQ